MPSHLAQKKNVAALPKPIMTMSTSTPESMKAPRAAHLEMSMPKGATNMPQMPSAMRHASLGMRETSASMLSMSREPMWCSAVPTHRKSSDLATAWKMSRNTPAHTAAAVPMPAQVTMRPRLATVE